jgi:antagonist of KipI
MSTVQDLGRTGWRRYGIPSSGALDRRACAAANLAVGNHPASAALELTFPGPKLKVLDGTQIAIAGADLDARLSGVAVDRGEAVRVRPGDVIDFEVPGQGQWAYLSVAGGIDVPEEFGSRSTYARGGLGGLHGRPLRAGDVLGRGEGACGSSGIMRPDNHGRSGPIGVIMGPQADAFTVEAQAALLSQPFEVTVQRDRSGMRLRGPALTHRRSAEILSDGLLPGAIQVPAEGQPIIIMADGPTTGGYTTIATVVDADLDRLAQAAPGTTIRFEAASVDSAHTREAARRMDPAGDAPRASEAGP